MKSWMIPIFLGMCSPETETAEPTEPEEEPYLGECGGLAESILKDSASWVPGFDDVASSTELSVIFADFWASFQYGVYLEMDFGTGAASGIDSPGDAVGMIFDLTESEGIVVRPSEIVELDGLDFVQLEYGGVSSGTLEVLEYEETRDDDEDAEDYMTQHWVLRLENFQASLSDAFSSPDNPEATTYLSDECPSVSVDKVDFEFSLYGWVE